MRFDLPAGSPPSRGTELPGAETPSGGPLLPEGGRGAPAAGARPPDGLGSTRPAPAFMAGVPNALSVLRILLALVFPLVAEGERLSLALVSGLSDWVDGFLARRYGLCSVIGGLLDAIGDKLFMAVAFATFAVEGILPTWQVLLVLSRDLIVLGCVAGVLSRRRFDAFRRMPANRFGKAATLGQFLFILVVLIRPEEAGWLFPPAAGLSLLAGASYLRRFLRGLSDR